jgi:polyphosphate kinase
MNALEEPRIVRALYEASQAGVRIDLIIRDSCRLRPGIKGLSENVRVTSIVGRFLEHARVFYFDIGGEEEYFIGSADVMRRNLSSRVEVLVPVEDSRLRGRLRHLLDTQLTDRRSAWDMAPDGSYRQLEPGSEAEAIGCHQRLIQWTEKSSKQTANALKKKPLVLGPRPGARKL